MHLLPVYMCTVHVCLMLHMYNVQCVCSRILLTVYHHNGIKNYSYFNFYQIEFSRTIPTYRCDAVAVKVFCLFFFWW